MKLEVTRDVVSDLWPLCRSGDASADSQKLVEAYLAEHGSFASELKESEMPFQVMPNIRLSPDAEVRLLKEAQKRARLKLLIIGGTIAVILSIGIVALGAAIFLSFSAG